VEKPVVKQAATFFEERHEETRPSCLWWERHLIGLVYKTPYLAKGAR